MGKTRYSWPSASARPDALSALTSSQPPSPRRPGGFVKPDSRKESNCCLRGHEDMTARFAGSASLPRPRAVMFNLGYRPGGDKSVITRPATTLTALASALELVVPGGVITVVLYPGHEGGRVETEAVFSWAGNVPAQRALVACHQVLNTRRMAPLLLAIAKGEAVLSAQVVMADRTPPISRLRTSTRCVSAFDEAGLSGPARTASYDRAMACMCTVV